MTTSENPATCDSCGAKLILTQDTRRLLGLETTHCTRCAPNARAES